MAPWWFDRLLGRGEATLACQAASVYFIYSFVLRGADSIIINPEDASEMVARTPGWATGAGIPSARQGIMPHLLLKTPATYASRLDAIESLSDPPGRIECLLRFMPTGGTCCIKVRVEASDRAPRRILVRDLLNVLALSFDSQQGYKLSSAEPPGNHVGLVRRLFDETMRDLCPAGEDGCSVRRLEEDAEQVLFQDPWVVTVLEVGGKVAADLLSGANRGAEPARAKMLQLRRYEADLAAILFRSVGKTLQLEPAYLAPPPSSGVPGLFSLNLDGRLNVHVSHRSALCVCRREDEEPADYFVPSLLDLCELTRARWHALVMMNVRLDVTLRSLRSAFDAEDPRKAREEVRRRILETREWLAASMEDPLTYTVAGEALSRIHGRLTEWLRLPSLKDLLFKKAELLDDAYEDRVSLRWSGRGAEQLR